VDFDAFHAQPKFGGVERRPEACALLTTSLTCEPLGITTLPLAVHVLRDTSDNALPDLCVLRADDWSMVTVDCRTRGTELLRASKCQPKEKAKTTQKIAYENSSTSPPADLLPLAKHSRDAYSGGVSH